MKARTIRYIVLLVLIIFIGGMYKMVRIKGWSDMPNILDKSKVMINLAAYDLPVPYTMNKITKIRDPERNDMVLFRAPESKGGILIVKRLVAGPGDLIEIRNHKLSINGTFLTYIYDFDKEYDNIPKERLLAKEIVLEQAGNYARYIALNERDPDNANFGPLLMPDDQYFVLGDNRSNSEDSRHFGTIPRKDILGKQLNLFNRNQVST
ncbi:signal peptidase I, partial [Bacteroidota bacterium]